MITISIVDDNPQLRKSIRTYLHGSPDLRCITEYDSAAAALEHLPEDKPDVVLMDINMEGMDGIECVARLKAKMPDVQVVMLTVYEDTDKIFRALSAGANGYLLKRAAPARLVEAIRDVHAGGSAMSSSIARKVVAHFQKAAAVAASDTHLSPREQAVLDCLAKGMTYKAIADQLAISIETVRTHLKRIYQKLHVQTLRARCLALPRAGSSMAARIAMIAMTTRSSIRVNAVFRSRQNDPRQMRGRSL